MYILYQKINKKASIYWFSWGDRKKDVPSQLLGTRWVTVAWLQPTRSSDLTPNARGNSLSCLMMPNHPGRSHTVTAVATKAPGSEGCRPRVDLRSLFSLILSVYVCITPGFLRIMATLLLWLLFWNIRLMENTTLRLLASVTTILHHMYQGFLW